MTTEPAKPKPRRRWLQYSLRTFFVLLTVFGVWLGVVVHRANAQRKVVEWVREMGGSVHYDYEYHADGQLIGDAKPPSPTWLVQLLGVDYFQGVSLVDFENQPVSDLTPLAGLTSLRWLEGDGTSVIDLTPLAGMTSLEGLYLSVTRVTDLTSVAGLKSLEELYLYNTQVSDLAPLEKLTSLRALSLQGTKVSDLTPLAELKNLEWLELEHTQVSEEQVEKLRQALPNCDISWSPPDDSA
ncbi:MAG: leucine-rich repeat domain-containing protein [Planctomycetes bacterium]|nr:leucine-rich repeat domain-containing protein [Planctomycetota bacterium]